MIFRAIAALGILAGLALHAPPAAALDARPAAAPKAPSSSAAQPLRNAPFDYYVMSLSWSPTFCEDEGDADKEPQCEAGRRYGFVTHGLWPQYEKGGWPEFCGDPGWVDKNTLARMDKIYPSRRLTLHQWRKHGVCSGMSAEEYFQTVATAVGTVKIPQSFRRIDQALRVAPSVIEAAFLEANPGMTEDGATVLCKDGRLSEVRICLGPALDFRACAPDARKDCRLRTIKVPPLR